MSEAVQEIHPELAPGTGSRPHRSRRRGHRATGFPRRSWKTRLRAAWRCYDEGMAAAEYAVIGLVACTFAGGLLTILTSSQVRGLMTNLIKRALSVA